MSLDDAFRAVFPSLDPGPFLPSAPELSALRCAPARLSHHAPWQGPARLALDEGQVNAWLRDHIDAFDDPEERLAAAYRLLEEKVTGRLLSRILADAEGETRDRAAVRRLARKLGVDPTPFLDVPPWFDAVVGTSSRRKQARGYARVPAGAGTVERAIAARGLLDTARELRMDHVGRSIAEVAPTLARLAGDDVGYVRLLALTACEWLARVADGDPAAAPLLPPLEAASVVWR